MRSEELFNEAKKYLPGGVDSPVRAYQPYPFFAIEAEGPRIHDVDGNTYLDYCLAYGPLVLGHTNPVVMGAVLNQMSKGTAYGVPTEKEIELAREVVDRMPCAEMVRFVSTGTEATMSAIRLARAWAGRKKIIKFEGAYHGAQDYTLVKSGSGAVGLPDSPGVPEETTKNTILVPFNDEEAMVKVFDRMGDDVAAIILEPVMGNVGCIEPQDGFLRFLRDLTTQNGSALIFDEVITGFRLSRGGAQEYYGVKPDLVTMGKILGGGFPMGALGGKKELMEMIAPSGGVYQAGTFNGNPISVTAGLATMELLDEDFYDVLNKRGEQIRMGIQDILTDKSLNYQVAGLESMFQIYFTERDVWNYEDAKSSDTFKFSRYFHQLLREGIFIPPSQFECCFLSTVHLIEDINTTLEAIENSITVAENI